MGQCRWEDSCLHVCPSTAALWQKLRATGAFLQGCAITQVNSLILAFRFYSAKYSRIQRIHKI